jgi:hypothetical protein
MLRRTVPLLALLLAACATTPAPAPPAPPPEETPPPRPDPWNAAPFSADPEHLVRAAEALPPPPDAAFEALVAETTVRLQRDGDRITARRVVRALPALPPGTGTVVLAWNPSHEDRPVLRARAIYPDGTVRWMEPVDFEETETGAGTRALRIELPVLPGMVIEQLSVTRLHPAASGRGRLPFATELPTRRARIAIEAPAGAPLRAVARGVAVKPDDFLVDGRQVLAFELSPVPVADGPAFAPPELAGDPAVEWTTAATWAEAVGPTAAGLEAALAGPGAEPLLRGLDRRGPPLAVAGRLLERLRRRVAIDPGPVDATTFAPAPNQSILHDTSTTAADTSPADPLAPTTAEPRGRAESPAPAEAAADTTKPADTPAPFPSPAAILAGKRGTALEAATVLVAALRSAGIPAGLALARAGGTDPLPDLPLLHGAHRVLVALPDGTFLDPAYPEAPSLPVPAAVEGRLAVLLAAGNPDPVPVPSSPAAASRSVVTRDVRFAGPGPARVVETVEGTGHLAAAYRTAWAEGGLERFRATVGDLEGWALGGKAEAYRVKPGRPGEPFRATFEVREARGAVRKPGEATVRLPPTALFFRLPLAQERGRTFDVVLPFAHVAELRTVVHLPRGLLPETPPTAPLPFGPLAVERSAKTGRTTVETRLVLDVDRRRFTPAEVDAMIDDAAVLTLSSELRLVPGGLAAPGRAGAKR